MDKLSLVIPACNEEQLIAKTVKSFHEILKQENIPHEILVVNDYSADRTEMILKKLSDTIEEVECLNNTSLRGFGYAVREGLNNFSGDCVAIVMADMSNRPEDLVSYYRKMEKGYDCVFGSRFIKGGKTTGYPFMKYILNRATNNVIRILFLIRYDDVTNAFKLYSRKVIKKVYPLRGRDFNLTVEIPLKAITRKFSYAVIPNHWIGRKETKSKFKIWKVGYQYFSMVLHCFFEKWFKKNRVRRN